MIRMEVNQIKKEHLLVGIKIMIKLLMLIV